MTRLAFGKTTVRHLGDDDGAVDEHAHRHDQGEEHHHVDRDAERTDQEDTQEEAARDGDADEQCRPYAEYADDDDKHEEHGRYSIIGSSNLDRQSLQHNYEVNIVSEDGDLSRAIEALFERDRLRSTPLTEDMLAQRSLFARAVDWGAAALLSFVGEGDPR